jgi:HAD superfamily hydrolase (TIGR01509 family)
LLRDANAGDITAVFFDLAGVLVGKPGKTKSLYEAIKARYGVSKKRLKQELARRGNEKTYGRWLAIALEEPLRDILGRPLDRPLLDLLPEPVFILENTEVVRALRFRCRTGVIANSDGFVEERLARAGLRDLFDVVVDSEIAGVKKPDPAIFRVALEAIDCRPEQCVFIDDKPANVEAAERLGMMGIVYSCEGGERLADLMDARCGLSLQSLR